MADQAQVTSVEAMAAFRADLLVYLDQIRPVIEEISSEVLRTRTWMEDDRGRLWLHELRLRNRRLETARQELFTAKLARMGESKTFELMAVQRAQADVREAEEKLAVLRRWDRDLEDRTAPLIKQMEQLHGFLDVEMERAVVYLDQLLRTLEAYRDLRHRPGGPAESNP